MPAVQDALMTTSIVGASLARLERIALVLAVSALFAACSHPQTAPKHPHAAAHVKPVGTDPDWAVFSPVGGGALGPIAAGFSTHEWVSQSGPSASGVVRIAFDGTTVEIATPTKGSQPGGLIAGPRGDMWVAETGAARLGKIAMPAGPIVEFPLPRRSEQPVAIAASADRDLWYVDGDEGVIGKMTTSGRVTEYHLAKIAHGSAIVAGGDGDVWFAGTGATGSTTRGFVGKIAPSGSTSEFALPVGASQPTGIAVGPDGSVWVAADGPGETGRIVKVSRTGAMFAYDSIGQPGAIAPAGPSDLDFTVHGQPVFGEISLTGSVTAHALPGDADRAVAVARGSDGNEWFSGSRGSKSAVFVRLKLVFDVTPDAVTLSAPGAAQTLTVSEKKHIGKWKVESSDDGVADITKGKTLDTFTVVGISLGTCTITISDRKGKSVSVPVTVK